MAKYSVTYACGHTGTVRLTGPTRTREWILKNKEQELCPDCYKAQLEAKREAERVAAAAEAAEQELPALVGTDKQVAWALTIRKKYLEVLDGVLQRRTVREDVDTVLAQQAVESIQREPSAVWWIENGRNPSDREIMTLVAKRYKGLLDLREAAGAVSAEEALAEATVRPETPVSEIPVQIRIRESTVEVIYPERNDTLREIVKGRGFRWNGALWARQIGKFAGTPADRAGEIGNLLLRAGFVIQVFDEVAREMAVSGSYEPEYVRWVTQRTGGDYAGWFSIQWERDNEAIYAAARKIAGSRWSKPNVVVPAAQYEAILDLVDEFGFQLSPGALGLIEAARATREAALVVKPVGGPEPIKGEPKEQTKPGEIDADLRDDD
ncbi:MAG: hypothetical protein PHT97_13755 [Methanoculleus sp.]|jgi:hypothetical protein|uniref:hypothetical protein n=1 Tax=Methanoculleus sp. TaxID=90427 RepID=UPI00260192F8|nr:hypothetical protein [Methanoculleus sp.]MDD4472207.1 hypothetical protein [Methanoculleus sp.]